MRLYRRQDSNIYIRSVSLPVLPQGYVPISETQAKVRSRDKQTTREGSVRMTLSNQRTCQLTNCIL